MIMRSTEEITWSRANQTVMGVHSCYINVAHKVVLSMKPTSGQAHLYIKRKANG